MNDQFSLLEEFRIDGVLHIPRALLSTGSARAETFLKMITRNTKARETHSRARDLFNDFPVTIVFKSSQNSRAVAAILVKQYGYSTR